MQYIIHAKAILYTFIYIFIRMLFITKDAHDGKKDKNEEKVFNVI